MYKLHIKRIIKFNTIYNLNYAIFLVDCFDIDNFVVTTCVK